MARLSPNSPLNESNPASSSGSRKQFITAFFLSISTILTSRAKQASRITKKVLTTKTETSLIESNKNAYLFLHKKKVVKELENDSGEGGIWERSIMMGDKCQPLAFSGVIYYDVTGKQVNEFPLKSLRASPLPFYAYKGAN